MFGCLAAVGGPAYTVDLSSSYLITLILMFFTAFFLVLSTRKYLQKKSFRKIWGYLAVLAVLLNTVLITGKIDRVFSILSLIFFCVFILISIGLQKYKKTAGTLLISLIVFIIIITAVFINSFITLTGEVKLATIRVLDINNQTMKLMLIPEKTKAIKLPTVISLKGTKFGVIMYRVKFKNIPILLGARTGYAWLGMTADILEKNKKNPDGILKTTDNYMFKDFFRRYKLFEMRERMQLNLPFIDSVNLVKTYAIAFKNAVYDVFVQNLGGVYIKRRQ